MGRQKKTKIKKFQQNSQKRSWLISFLLSFCQSINMSTSMSERMKKLRELHSKRQEARQLNHSQVVEEDRRNKEPKNMEQRRKRAQYLLDEEKMRSECEAQGKDFEREKMKMIPADEAETSDRRKKQNKMLTKVFLLMKMLHFENTTNKSNRFSRIFRDTKKLKNLLARHSTQNQGQLFMGYIKIQKTPLTECPKILRLSKKRGTNSAEDECMMKMLT